MVCQIRYKNKPVFRVDVHPTDPQDRTPVPHFHIAPDMEKHRDVPNFIGNYMKKILGGINLMRQFDVICNQLGTLLIQYLDGHCSFGQVENSISDAIRSDPSSRSFLNQVYHILNHFEIDESLRRQDPEYAAATTDNFRSIARCLISSSDVEIQRAIADFWR